MKFLGGIPVIIDLLILVLAHVAMVEEIVVQWFNTIEDFMITQQTIIFIAFANVSPMKDFITFLNRFFFSEMAEKKMGTKLQNKN